MSPGWCTLSRVSYAALPRYCRNYALKIYDARRNRRNAPSMARFSLPCHPWQGISVYRVHNSTVSKQLRYSLTRESVPQLVSRDKAPCTVAECRLIGVQCRNSMKKYKYGKRKIMMTKNCRYATINSKHYISVNTTPQHILSVRITLKRADHFAFFDKDMEIFNALCYQLIAGKLKCQM